MAITFRVSLRAVLPAALRLLVRIGRGCPLSMLIAASYSLKPEKLTTDAPYYISLF